MPAVTAPVELHRTRDRRHLQLPFRVERLEEDADISESNFVTLAQKVDTMNARLLGVLISTASSAVLFAANLLVHH